MPPKPAGLLIPLRTHAEVRSGLQTVNVYILPIPAKTANEVIIALREIAPQNELQHLRRLSKPAFLPASVAANLPPTQFPPEQSLLYLLVCQIDRAPIHRIASVAAKTSPFQRKHGRPITPKPQISIVTVPANMPTSPEQGEEWTKKYWPTVYKRGNPFGPHPSLIENSAAKLTRVSEYMAMARKVGREAAEAGVGYPLGAVIVNPDTGDVIAAAGDARLHQNGRDWCYPLDHPVLRLVEMVAQKRLEKGVVVAPDNPITALTETERTFLNSSTMGTLDGRDEIKDKGNDGTTAESAGYLCHNMHVYLTHEPCVMCSMALLHSRVAIVVFEHRMIKTGALGADVDQGLGHGLFWRPDLNWKYLAWQWKEAESTKNEVPDNIHA
ncbi:cytidine deaminase-like protein [Wilcoxina mikolae CBS 423.85]|nr:cytidine deaminase-like protein [Wilcoxina mikolae CBS 423.85]